MGLLYDVWMKQRLMELDQSRNLTVRLSVSIFSDHVFDDNGVDDNRIAMPLESGVGPSSSIHPFDKVFINPHFPCLRGGAEEKISPPL